MQKQEVVMQKRPSYDHSVCLNNCGKWTLHASQVCEPCRKEIGMKNKLMSAAGKGKYRR